MVAVSFYKKRPHFQDLPPVERREHVRKLKLCFNCFGVHHVKQCTSNMFVTLQTEAGSNTQSFMKTLLQKIKQYDPRQHSNRFNFMAQIKLPFYKSNCLTGRKRLRHMLISTKEVEKVSSTNPQLWIQVLTSTFLARCFLMVTTQQKR